MAVYLIILIAIFVINLLLLIGYKKVALKSGIIANPNFRALHDSPTLTGAGIIFALTTILTMLFAWLVELISLDFLLIVSGGGLIAATFGLIDDNYDLKAKNKLIFQISLSAFALFYLRGGPLLNVDFLPNFLAILLSSFFLVWVINAYNFIDGIDSLASSGAILAGVVVLTTLWLTNVNSEIITLLSILIMSLLAFIIFNWPPASLFMGDSGSVFLGYIFGSIILYTTMRGEVSLFTWIIAFGYFISDTTVTQIARVFLVKKWYLAHRSHAYQNYARESNSHLKVVLFVVAYYLIWLLPLAILSAKLPNFGIFAAIAALFPALIFSYKYGPVYSSK